MTSNAVRLLEIEGDPVEQKGIKEYQLGSLFPNYAEFWSQYIFPRRNENDASMLQPGLRPEIENIFKYHYGVFYHLVAAFEHRERIDIRPMLNVAAPFYHLGAAIESTQRLFIVTLHATEKLPPVMLEQGAFEAKMKAFWKEEGEYKKNGYETKFRKFHEKYGPPVSIEFHSVEGIFKEAILKIYKAESKNFQGVSNTIKQYRNMLIHDRSPLKIVKRGKVYIPKPDYLAKYREASWSYRPTEDETRTEFVIAEEKIAGLTRFC